jgi:hypothetical protein
MTEQEIMDRVNAAVAATRQSADKAGIPWRKILIGIGYTLALLAVASIVWTKYFPKQQASTTPTVQPEAVKVVDVPKVTIKGPKILEVYDKEKFGKKIPLPPEVKDNPSAAVTAAADIKPSRYGGTATAFTNTSTGKSGIVYQAKERPFFEFKRDVEIYAEYGVSTKGSQQAAAGSRWTFLRTGPVHYHVRGEVNSQPEAKALVGVHTFIVGGE